MGRQYKVVDSDGHVCEPPDLWVRYIAAEYKDRAPRLVKCPDGEERLNIDGKMGGQGIRRAGAVGAREGKPYPKTYLDGIKGGFDPHARIKDLDLDGIDAVILYPSMGLFSGSVDDPKFAAALCRAYNIWLAEEYCSPYPDRLFGVAMLPMQSVELAVEELKFARNKLGLRSAFIRPNPYNNRLLSNPDYNPLWAAAQDLDMPIGLHEGTGGMPAASRDRVYGNTPAHIASHTVEMMLACLNLIWNGVCDRYPRLRFAFVESGGGWMAPWLDRMDRHYDDRTFRADPPPPLRPSEYFERQCWIAFEPAEKTLAMHAEYLGGHKVMWATDYPHNDGWFPGAPKMIADKLKEPIRSKVLGESAAQLYKLA